MRLNTPRRLPPILTRLRFERLRLHRREQRQRRLHHRLGLSRQQRHCVHHSPSSLGNHSELHLIHTTCPMAAVRLARLENVGVLAG
jgi:hypothetical protein